jgi:hypothetical protein
LTAELQHGAVDDDLAFVEGEDRMHGKIRSIEHTGTTTAGGELTQIAVTSHLL